MTFDREYTEPRRGRAFGLRLLNHFQLVLGRRRRSSAQQPDSLDRQPSSDRAMSRCIMDSWPTTPRACGPQVSRAQHAAAPEAAME